MLFKQKKMAVEPENQEDRLDEDSEAEGVSSTSSQPPELQEPTASKFCEKCIFRSTNI